ncbi:MAG TPA: AbrB/MazE/SpoVT family DNA-binding domain-containing protein [Geminicoccus sp.]|nr:AbrB/MazE/SpoVT family DNA-binding domain-containing protein [Geminicoccus sp.]
MTTATISSKGQTTIPGAIRRGLGLAAGDRVEFLLAPGGYAVLLPRDLQPRDLRGLLPRPDRPATVEEMHEAVVEAATFDG